jgi:hypothetical protein
MPARSVPQELERIVPDLPSVPVQPILFASANEYGMFEHFKRYPWVLKIHRYNNIDDLLKSLGEKVIAPAEEKAKVFQKIDYNASWITKSFFRKVCIFSHSFLQSIKFLSN